MAHTAPQNAYIAAATTAASAEPASVFDEASASVVRDGDNLLINAGSKPVDHYKSNMSLLRFRIRNYLLQIVREETDTLARLQAKVRTPLLDQYFALTANLGTHTFYMVMLPFVLWTGKHVLGREMLWLLALGVYFTGVVKDYLCLPRPRSPPVHRISMSGSAVLEYGFPSTHSCNAISVGILFAQVSTSWVTHSLNIVLILSIIFGRLYNGMHGLMDVICGSIMGVFVWAFRHYTTGPVEHYFQFDSPIVGPALTMTAAVLACIVFHPQPVDNCPCYDDSVAFMSVVLGLYLGFQLQHFRGYTTDDFLRFGGSTDRLWKLAARFVLGVAVIVTWRAVMKPLLFRILPPLFRSLKSVGVDLPRRYFLSASEYTELPKKLPDDLLPESPKEIAQMIRDVRKSRGRNDSVGPQSQSDFYETMHNAQLSHTEMEAAEHYHIKPQRTRYDVEVTTKFIVYTGIPFLVITYCVDLFRLCRLY